MTNVLLQFWFCFWILRNDLKWKCLFLKKGKVQVFCYCILFCEFAVLIIMFSGFSIMSDSYDGVLVFKDISSLVGFIVPLV